MIRRPLRHTLFVLLAAALGIALPGWELEVLRCPFDRGIMVLTHRTADVVEPGIYAYMVGNLATAER